ncbi:hypothetical protein BY996DRAFT_7414291 [Phakopsora pachyrhizi]|nr:hypothetical protein BY996DRAFT_7414291 [Phakopsora pachyrhizi]
MTLIIGPYGKIKLIAFVLHGFMAFQSVSCMYEDAIKSTGSKPFGELQKELKDLSDVSLDGLRKGAVEAPSSLSELPGTSHLRRKKTILVSEAIEINQEKISQLRDGYKSLLSLVDLSKNEVSGKKLGAFDHVTLEKILDIVKILTTVRHQQLAADKTLRAAQLELQHESELETYRLNSDISIKIIGEVLNSILDDFITINNPTSFVPSKILIGVIDYILKNKLLESEKNITILRQPWFHRLIGNVVWERYVKSEYFNPFFFSLDFQNYVSSHPSMEDAHYILRALDPKAWKWVLFGFMHKLPVSDSHFSHLTLSGYKLLLDAINSLTMEVPELNSFSRVFNGDIFKANLSAAATNNQSAVFFAEFFPYIFLFHVLKAHIKFAPDVVAERVTQELRVFENVFGLFVPKIKLNS